VADVLTSHDGTAVDYEMRRLDFLLFNLVHQFRMLPLQIIFIGISALAIKTFNEHGVAGAVLVGGLTYVAQWMAQAVFLILLVISRNRRLYTRHEVKPLQDSLEVLTTYAHQYYYWQGLERVLITPWFVAVYVNKQAAHVIPNRAFRNAESRRDFITIVETMRNV